MQNGNSRILRANIFTEGGSLQGYGHIMRCMALYDEFTEIGVPTTMFINADSGLDVVLGHRSYVIADWYSRDFIEKTIDKSSVSLIDSYIAGEDVYASIAKCSIQSLYIDDFGRMEYPEGIIINPSPGIDAIRYTEENLSKLVWGYDYVILRKDFFEIETRQCLDKVNEILVTLGGSDVRNLTPKIVRMLIQAFPWVKVNVVVGNGYKNIDEIRSISGECVAIYSNLSADKMKHLMIKSDFAITAAGQTIFELLRTETPFIPIEVVDNQKNNIAELSKIGFGDYILKYDTDNFIESLHEKCKSMIQYKKRTLIIDQIKGLVDGKGSKRIIEHLMRSLTI